MADIFDEIRDDLRAERFQLLLRRYGLLLLVAAVLGVAGILGWQAWRSRQSQASSDVAARFIAAMRQADATPAGVAAGAPATVTGPAIAAFSELANGDTPDGYRTLARLRAAALRASSGDLPGALRAWDDVAGDPQADPMLRDLASLLWAQAQVDMGVPAAVEQHLTALVAPGSPWRPLALHTQALLALRTGDAGRAREITALLLKDQNTPPNVRIEAAMQVTQDLQAAEDVRAIAGGVLAQARQQQGRQQQAGSPAPGDTATGRTETPGAVPEAGAQEPQE